MHISFFFWMYHLDQFHNPVSNHIAQAIPSHWSVTSYGSPHPTLYFYICIIFTFHTAHSSQRSCYITHTSTHHIPAPTHAHAPLISLTRTPHHIAPYHTTSYHSIPHHPVSQHIISHHPMSFHITAYHIISHHITSYHITSHHIISHHITS